MAQVKIYGIREHLDPMKTALSEAIHSSIVEALKYPVSKRAHRFFPMAKEDFHFPESATERYTIVEVSMFEGRSIEAKKRLIKLLFQRIGALAKRLPNEIEITITETPRHNWGLRGRPGDEVSLSYEVQI